MFYWGFFIVVIGHCVPDPLSVCPAVAQSSASFGILQFVFIFVFLFCDFVYIDMNVKFLHNNQGRLLLTAVTEEKTNLKCCQKSTLQLNK